VAGTPHTVGAIVNPNYCKFQLVLTLRVCFLTYKNGPQESTVSLQAVHISQCVKWRTLCASGLIYTLNTSDRGTMSAFLFAGHLKYSVPFTVPAAKIRTVSLYL
jgi:hypothetical protein